MPPDTSVTDRPTPPIWATLRRFLVYLWPTDAPALRLRVVLALMLVIAGKAVTLIMPFAYKGVIDRMTTGMEGGATIAVALVATVRRVASK